MDDKKFEFFETTGDVGILVYGKTAEDIFINAGLGLYEIITDVKKEETESREVKIISDSISRLFINWLNELIFLFDTYNFVANNINLSLAEKSGEISLESLLKGYCFDEQKDEKKLLIKAATYHGHYLKQTEKGYEAKVLFDI